MGWARAGWGGVPGHHFLFLLGAVGGEALGDDVGILQKDVADGLRTQTRVRGAEVSGANLIHCRHFGDLRCSVRWTSGWRVAHPR